MSDACATCGKPATIFYRDDDRIVFACTEHGDASGKWKSVTEMNGATLALARNAAELKRQLKQRK